ncbi:hypothetical protein TYRP_009146 [Tyrophagus putrescentiae]|nr:hypothetical protein TYRP_009146 [Tyrophagus putrescentiae]
MNRQWVDLMGRRNLPRQAVAMMGQQYSHSYESLGRSTKSTAFCCCRRSFHPRTVTAIILLAAMFLILCLLHFVISPRYSTVVQNFTRHSSSRVTSATTTVVELPDSVLDSMTNQMTRSEGDDADRSSSPKVLCHPDQLPPGVAQLVIGVDITKLDLLLFTNTSSSFAMEPIFEYTCSGEEELWTDPRDTSSSYSRPDQLTALKFVPGDRFQLRTQFYQNLTRLKHELAAQYGLEQHQASLGVESATWRELQKEVLGAESSVLQISSYYSTLQLHFNFSHSLSPAFISALRALPSKYSEAPEKYEALFDRFGTAYFESAALGAVYYQQTTISPEYLYLNDRSEITAKTVALFLSRIIPKEEQVNGSSPFTSFDDQQLYNRHTKSTFRHFDEQVPVLYGGSLKPLDSLIPESNLKQQLGKAIHVRALKAQLEELKSQLELTGVELKGNERHLLAHIREFLDEKLYLKFGNLNQVEERMGEVARKANEEKDRALLSKYYAKLTTMSDDVLLCKWSLARACHPNQLNVDFEAANRLDDRLRVTYQTLINRPQWTPPLPQSELFSLLNSTVKHIHQQVDTVVDICASYISTREARDRCWQCLQENVDCWYCQQTACSSPASWRVIQYVATRRYVDAKVYKGGGLQCDCRTVLLSPQPSEKNNN